eukprot:TRINITY_DN52249_c0_g1_i1.p1 TRINITY_DN52249_c0_g1~~TRINITY_DN52249_c0_g1_i1.p1  ORF type:complete len:414 (-),score=27.29 TRINITY_DN52249_c0_g1_i1:47-1150(-)
MHEELFAFVEFATLTAQAIRNWRYSQTSAVYSLDRSQMHSRTGIMREQQDTHSLILTWFRESTQLTSKCTLLALKEAHAAHKHKSANTTALMHVVHNEAERRRMMEQWCMDMYNLIHTTTAQLTLQDAKMLAYDHRMFALWNVSSRRINNEERQSRMMITWSYEAVADVMREWSWVLYTINHNPITSYRLVRKQLAELQHTEADCRSRFCELALHFLDALHHQHVTIVNTTETVVHQTYNVHTWNQLARIEIEEQCMRDNWMSELSDGLQTIWRWHVTVREAIEERPSLQSIECLDDVKAMNLFSLQEYRMREYQLWRQLEEEKFQCRLRDSKLEEQERTIGSLTELSSTLKDTVHDLCRQLSMQQV